MKRILMLFILLVPLWLAGQDLPFTVKAKTKYSASVMVGYEKIDSLKYYQIRFIQEFKVWKLGMGLDLDFLFDPDYHLRKADWNQLDDVLDKIYYLKYNQKGDPFFFHLGGFPSLTMGNGLIMHNYSNMLLYPELRNNGLMIGGNPPLPMEPSIELFTSDIRRNQVLSFTARAKPMPDSTLKYLDGLVVGVTAAADLNQYGNLKHTVSDSLLADVADLDRKPVSIFGVGYTLPLIKTEKMTFGNYAEFAHIAGNGSGAILPGLYTDFRFLKVNLEYRIYGSQFTPAFFDGDYEEERAIQPDETIAAWVTKKDQLRALRAAHGFNGSIQGLISNKVKASFAWQNLMGRELKTGKSIWIKLWVDTQYKRLENVSLSYSKTNTESMAITRINEPNAKIQAAFTVRVSKERWYMIGKYSESYKDKNKDGRVDWLKESKRSVGVGLKYVI